MSSGYWQVVRNFRPPFFIKSFPEPQLARFCPADSDVPSGESEGSAEALMRLPFTFVPLSLQLWRVERQQKSADPQRER